jgi:very-short-patch-repair endonuclease
LLRRQNGVVSRRQALRFTTAKVVDWRIASGRWQRVHRGVFVTHSGPLTEQQRLWAASLAVGAGRPALLGGLSALIAHGLRRFDSRHIDLLLPTRRRDRNPPPGIRVHRASRLPATQINGWMGPPATTPPRAVVDAAQWATTDVEARTIVAISFQQGLVKGDEVDRVLAGLPVVPRRSLIGRTARDAQDGSHTLTELDLVELCRAAGLPVPSRQVRRRDASGRTRFLDAVFEEWGIRVEIDGSHHMSADEWWQDMIRHNDLSRRGEVVLRFPAWLVRDRPAAVIATLRRALMDAGWSPQ